MPQLFTASETGQSLRTAPSLVRKITVGPHATFRGLLFGARRSYGGPRRRKWVGIIQIGDARGMGILSGLGCDHQCVVALDLQLAAVEDGVVAQVGVETNIPARLHVLDRKSTRLNSSH